MIRHRIATAAALLLTAGVATAQQSPYYIGASETISHESNLLSLANGAATPAGYSKSDTIFTTALFGGVDQPIGRQRVYGSISVRDLRYSDNSRYNNVAYSGNVGLDWSTIERISGTLTAGASRALASFDNANFGVLLQEKNLETSGNVNATFNVGLVTQYSFELTAGHLRVRNSSSIPYIQARDYDQNTGSVGLRWRPTSATNLGFALRGTKGEYPRYVLLPGGGYQEDRFTQKGAELTGSIQPTGASTFDGRLGYAKTSYDLNQQRDFSGVTGTIGWVWAPGGRLRLTTRLTRDTGQDAYANLVSTTSLGSGGFTTSNFVRVNNYARVSNVLRVQGDYSLTAKVGLTGAYQALQRTIVNTVLDPTNPASRETAKEFSNEFSLGARWTPLRSVQLGCDIRYYTRDASGSPNLSYDFKNNVYSCFGQLTLQ